MAGSRIKTVKVRQVLDGNGRPVIEADIVTESGHLGRAGASTGTSVGANEAHVLRDKKPGIYNGLSVYQAIRIVETIIAPEIIGLDVLDQETIDRTMIALDGTKNKTKLGGNAIYAVSVAAARAASAMRGQPLYLSMAKQSPSHIFAPAANLINGGAYSDKTLDFQEFMIIPYNIDDMAQGVRVIAEVFQRLGDVICKSGGKPQTGHSSGYGAPSDDPFEVMDMIAIAVAELGYQKHVCYALDCAGSGMFDRQEDAYRYRGRLVSRDELISIIQNITKQYPVAFVEDALDEEDFHGHKIAAKSINALLLGDDLLCTNFDRAKKAVEMGSVHGMIFKPNQAGTLTEAFEAAAYMRDNGLLVVASGRAGGVADAPEKEFAIAMGLHLSKNGAPRGTRSAGYNLLLRTAEELSLPMADIGKLSCFSHLVI